jgi:tetratricopeptide (TPR) repeat protein
MQRGVFSPASLQGLVPQIELGGAGLSVATVVGSLRRALGITDAEINGEIVVASGPGRDTDLYSVHIRVDIDGGQEATASAQSIENADELFAFAARRIVEQATPYVAASYYYYYLQKETAAGSAERDRYLALAERMIVTCVNSGDAELVARATNLRGVIAQYVRKDPVEAVARFRQVARGTKAYPASRYNLAEAYRAHALDWRRRIDGEARVRELAEAKAPALEGVAADYSRSSQSTGYYITGSVSLALAQLSIRRARQHHYLAALRYFDLSLEENPQRADAYRAQADALISIRQDFGAAVPACERAVELGDAQVLCYSVLANHYLRSGSVWKALEVQRRVREMFPKNQELQRDLSS